MRIIKNFFKRIFNIKTKFIHQGFVYIDKNGEPIENEITETIRWLETIEVKGFSYEDSLERIFEMFHFKYPELKGKIWIY